MSPSNVSSPPDYLFQLWSLHLHGSPNKFSSLIAALIRISILYEGNLNNNQHFLILRKLIAIIDTPNVNISIKLEVLQYLRHITTKYFTVEHQNDILSYIRQLFNRSFTDSNPIVKSAAFAVYAGAMNDIKHENIHPDHITDDQNVKIELMDFMKKQGKSIERWNDSIPTRRTMPSNDCDVNGLEPSERIRMREIVKRIQIDAKELMELNGKVKLTEEMSKDIASICLELASVK